MANVFRSKEVFKKIPKDDDEDHKIIPVRGVYVTGEYTPPYYTEFGITLKSIDSTYPDINDFTTESEEASDSVIGLLDFDSPFCSFECIRFKTESVDASPTNTIGLLNFDCNINSFQVYRFETDKVDTPDSTVGLLNFECPIGIQFTRQTSSHKSNTPMPILRLTNLTSEPATISNYNK